MKGDWVRRHPLLLYFAMVFGISWGGIGCIVAASGFELGAPRPLETGLIFVAMLLGPSVGGLTMTALVDGRVGLRELWVRLSYWRVDGRWYAVALLTMPVLLGAVLLTLGALASPTFAPRLQFQMFSIGIVAGCFEEVGWTGFATPHLLARHRSLIAGLSLGMLWALWHLLVDFRQNSSVQGIVWLLEFAVFYLATLTAYRLLMIWLYARTQSLLLAILMHASYTGWLLALYPTTSLEQGLIWQTAFAVTLWVAVGVVFARSARRISPHATQRPTGVDGLSDAR